MAGYHLVRMKRNQRTQPDRYQNKSHYDSENPYKNPPGHEDTKKGYEARDKAKYKQTSQNEHLLILSVAFGT